MQGNGPRLCLYFFFCQNMLALVEFLDWVSWAYSYKYCIEVTKDSLFHLPSYLPTSHALSLTRVGNEIRLKM